MFWSRIVVERTVVAPDGAAIVAAFGCEEWLVESDELLVESEPAGAGLVDRCAAWARQQIARLDIATDLRVSKGSARWWRGIGVMLALIAAALGLKPGLSPVEAAPAMRIDAWSQDELRSQLVAPLAAGGDSGRHMGATPLALAAVGVPERKRVELVATMAGSDSFPVLLARVGVGRDEAARASALVESAMPLTGIPAGTRIDIVLGATGGGVPRTIERLALRPRFDLDIALRRTGNGFTLERHALAVDTTPLRIRGLAGPSLYRSARAAGAPMRAIQQYLQVLDNHFGLDDVQPTDSFDMILSYRRTAGGSVEAGDLLYAGLERDGEPRARLMRWGSGGGFFDAAGMNEQRAGNSLLMPVAGHVTSSFGMRFHPILGYSRMHAGVDLGAPWGSPIYAVADGAVVWAGPHGGHGNFVRLEHGGGLATGYAHMSRYAVAPGMRVRAGQVIGYVGSSGLSTGPHLHYEVYENGRPVDPMSVHFTVRSGVGSGEMAAFKARLAQLLLVRPGAAFAPMGDVAHSTRGLAPLR